MESTAKEILQYVEENDVKFVKLTFCDLFGRQRNVSIVSQQLPSIFEHGYLFNSSAVPGFVSCVGDLLLFPDPKTLSVLPWRPQTGAVVSLLCHIKYLDGSFYEGDTLHLLDVAKGKLGKAGLRCEIGTESEFYIFKVDEGGAPTNIPIDCAGYFDCAPDDEGENVRRDIILNLEDMGIVPTSSHHERGPGQNEIDFMPTEPGRAARNFLYFKAAVKNICHLNGLRATFEPAPLPDSPCSGLRILITVEGAPQKTTEAFAAGIMQKAGELIPFLNTTPESILLFRDMCAATVDYSHPDRAALLSIIPQKNGGYGIEWNISDCRCNPFLAFALLLEAGMYGVGNGLSCADVKMNVKNNSAVIDTALKSAEESAWLQSILSKAVLDKYIAAKRSLTGAKK